MSSVAGQDADGVEEILRDQSVAALLQQVGAFKDREVVSALEEVEARRLELAACRDRLAELGQRRPAAESRDRAAYAAALRAGGQPPASEETETSALNKEVAEVRRRVEALELLVEEHRAALVAALEKSRPKWGPRVAEVLRKAHSDLEEARRPFHLPKPPWILEMERAHRAALDERTRREDSVIVLTQAVAKLSEVIGEVVAGPLSPVARTEILSDVPAAVSRP
jgi:hypothetical protein